MVPTDLGTGLGDKLSHAVVYGLLTLCWLKAGAAGRSRRWVLGIIFVPVLIGTFVELTQSLVGRSCSLMDWLANVAGVSIASIFWLARKHWRKRP